MHVNFFILNALPVPVAGPDDRLSSRAIKLAARLASPDKRYEEFARACGVSAGPISDVEKNDMIAELDAVVAAMYGMNAEDLEVVFRGFTLDAVPDARRTATRTHFGTLSQVART